MEQIPVETVGHVRFKQFGARQLRMTAMAQNKESSSKPQQGDKSQASQKQQQQGSKKTGQQGSRSDKSSNQQK